MVETTKTTRQNRTITVDFQDKATYFELISAGKAFVAFGFAFIVSFGFQRHHKASCKRADFFHLADAT